MKHDIASMRQHYANEALDMASVNINPFEEFHFWFDEAVKAEVREPNAMTLATVDAHGMPDARVVLLKELDDTGFVFYTNYTSDKSRQIENNPNACLVFSWLELGRQVRIRGKLEKYDEEKSIQYFQSRPRDSQIGAWSSPQSRVIEDRTVIEKLVAETEALFEGQDTLPKPPHWGGYLLVPSEIEFWQGRLSRLHDRIKFRKEEGRWAISRLAP
ncbi:MAG TPA: pyridoxamine 5'-phosphate oxidase [Saprospiraceae bacterium]|nr:pyridoxamine 5'-phosphate oxidase [Saprospiraceae bacterium]HRG20653.1 pyridoxamine 5'-phosphate oxidase [Saprospiraceae bacterium]